MLEDAKMTLGLSFKASRPLPAALAVACTFLGQAGAGGVGRPRGERGGGQHEAEADAKT